MSERSFTSGRPGGAARTLFAENGWEGATSDAIAERAGVAVGTLYRHFRDKKDLFLSCIEPLVGEALERSAGAALGATSLREIVRASVQARFDLLRDHGDVFKVLFTEMAHHPELGRLFIEQSIVNRAAEYAPAFVRLMEAGELRRMPNLLFLGPGLMVAMWAMLTGNLVEDLTDLILYGLAGQADGGDR